MSSNQTAIKVNGLSKTYLIYDKPEDRLKQSIIPKVQSLLNLKPTHYFREFWALNDISFEINKGETLGIIGRNGSGKSTLLQIICGTSSPTSGYVETYGRVAALLELGSGFNPEFSGVENVYMNAAVLGLTKEEIDERFEAIKSFADIGDFIYQPVKTYSSGMMLRLAFAVIAHVDADILVIDEALAVGDFVFSQKCMRYLRGFMQQGTVIFVSHDTGSVINLCNQVIWLDKGSLVAKGDAKDVVKSYIQYSMQKIYGDKIQLVSSNIDMTAQSHTTADVDANLVDYETSVSYFSQMDTSAGWETGKARILSIRLLDAAGNDLFGLHGGELVNLEIVAIANEHIYSPIIGWFVKDRLGQSLFGEHTYTYVQTPMAVTGGEKIRAVFRFFLPMLPNGDYSVTVSIAEGNPYENVQHHWLHDALILNVKSEKLRYGLVGIQFNDVQMNIVKTV